jgi:hypothetical protein
MLIKSYLLTVDFMLYFNNIVKSVFLDNLQLVDNVLHELRHMISCHSISALKHDIEQVVALVLLEALFHELHTQVFIQVHQLNE